MSVTIVLGYDGSEVGRRRAAATIIARSNVRRASSSSSATTSRRGRRREGTIREAMSRSARRAVEARWRTSEAAGIEVVSRLVEAKPADALIQVAEEVGADTIVVGTVGENPISGALMGSVVLAARAAFAHPAPRRPGGRRIMTETAAADVRWKASSSGSTRRSRSTGSRSRSREARSSRCSGRRGVARRRRCG